MRSQYVSASMGPASVSGGSCLASAYTNVLYRAFPRPSVGAERGTPRKVRLYLTDGMPARPALRIIWQMPSICLPRSGSFARRMAGLSLREISLELRGSGTMSSVRPNDSTRSRRRVKASTDHASSRVGEGRRLQM